MLGGLIGLGMLGLASGLSSKGRALSGDDEYEAFLNRLVNRQSREFRSTHADAVRMINKAGNPKVKCEDRHSASLFGWRSLVALRGMTKNQDLLANIDDMGDDLWEESFETFDRCCRRG